MNRRHAAAFAFCLLAAACSGSGEPANETNSANHISEDPFGATGAPGADMTDNGATDGASGMADGNGSENLAELGNSGG
ncbi:MAG TPA: hypothetical protein VGB62_08805 [Allosphingosinicella sp.]|jgi:hypothetical protein